MNRTQAATYLPPFRNHKDVVAAIGAGTNGQLVKAILSNYPRAVIQTQQLAKRFDRGNLEDTAHAVWDFLKHQIRYVEDSGLMQHMRLPNALVATGQGDCKSYSLFAAGIMANLGYPVTFRFTGYGGATHPGHVYILAGKKPVIIDAVWKAYNSEKKPYSYKKDYPMEIATISGIGCAECQQEIAGVKDIGKKVKTTLQKVKQKVVQNVPAVLKNPVKAILGAGPRTAFLQLVKLNIHDFAGRLNRNRNAALAKWKDLGGIPGELNASINAGMQRKPILGLYGIGEPVSVSIAAILAAAAPVIVALASLLGKGKTTEMPSNANVDTGSGTNTPVPPSTDQLKDGLRTATDILTEANNVLTQVKTSAQAFGGKGTDPSYSGGGYSAPSPSGGSPSPYTPEYSGDTTTPPGTVTPEGGSGSKWLIPAAIVAVLLLAK